MLNTLWLNNTVYFGLRGQQEHNQMLWSDLELHTYSSGREYISFSERSTKTRQGTTRDSRPFQPKMFATGIDKI